MRVTEYLGAHVLFSILTQPIAGNTHGAVEQLSEYKEMFTLLDLCASSLRRGNANLLCIVPILSDDPREEST